jgi:hypothetical protein
MSNHQEEYWKKECEKAQAELADNKFMVLTVFDERDKLSDQAQRLIAERDKLTAEFSQVIGLLSECIRVLRELNCYDPDFYCRTCNGLISAIGTHLADDKV